MKTKVFFLIFIMLIIFNLASCVVFGCDDIISTGRDWTDLENEPITGSENVYAESNTVAGMLWVVGLFAFGIVGIITGIKYMFAAGAANKAEVKKSMLPLLIGGGIILGALSIWQILIKFFEEL